MIKLVLSVFLIFALATGGAPLQAAQKQVSDDLIYNQVREKLAVDPDVKGGALDIDVKDGNVVLKGTVHSEKRKAKAEKLTKKVAGVKAVDNQIRVVLK